MASVRTVRPPVAAPPEPRPPTVEPPTAADFPGCKPVSLPREELDGCEMRLEYWDTATETAWICDPVSSYHEDPVHTVSRLAERIAVVRGAPVKCFGCTDLTERDAHGEPRLIMQKSAEGIVGRLGTAEGPNTERGWRLNLDDERDAG